MGTVPIEDVYRQIREFAAEEGVRRVILFGSRAKGTNRPKSDIDLAVNGGARFESFQRRVQDDLWSLLKVDIVNLDEPISDELRREIATTGKVLYEKV